MRWIGTAFLLLLMFGLPTKWASSQTTLIPVKTTNMIVSWTCDGKDVSGGTDTLATCEVAISGPAVDLRAPGSTFITSVIFPTAVGVNTGDATALVAARGNGQYRLWFRVYDAAKNVSTWAGPLEIVTMTVDVTPPTPPVSITCSSR